MNILLFVPLSMPCLTDHELHWTTFVPCLFHNKRHLVKAGPESLGMEHIVVEL